MSFLFSIAGKTETTSFFNRIFALSPSQQNFISTIWERRETSVLRIDSFSFYKINSRSYSSKKNNFFKNLFSPLIVRSNCTVSSDKRVKNTKKMSKKVAFKRLPANIVPKHYILELKPDLQKFTFAGKTSVKIQVSFFFLKNIHFAMCFII